MKRLPIALLCALAVLSSTSLSHAQSVPQGDTTDPAPTDDRHAIGEALWISGLSVWVATYVLTGVTGTTLVQIASARSVTIAESWIPLAGPFVMLADSRGFDSIQIALSAVSGVLQIFGCGAFIAGVVLDTEASDTQSVALLPMAGDAGAGLMLAGWL